MTIPFELILFIIAFFLMLCSFMFMVVGLVSIHFNYKEIKEISKLYAPNFLFMLSICNMISIALAVAYIFHLSDSLNKTPQPKYQKITEIKYKEQDVYIKK